MPFNFDDLDDVFDVGPEKEAYIAAKWFLQAFGNKIMRCLVWYSQFGQINFKRMSWTTRTIGGAFSSDADHLSRWKWFSRGMSTVSGGVFGLGSWLALPVDVVILVDGMFRTGFGVGTILAPKYGLDHTALERKDFLNIFAQWCEVEEFIDDDKAVAEVINAFSGEKVMVKVGSKAAIKFAVKAAMKMGFKVTGNAGALVIPGVNIAANAGINTWYIEGFFNAAEIYYHRKFLAMQEK